jgi:predicted dehydrogenase
VPTPQHHAVARRLLEGGIDVLVEKPLTTTVQEGQDLVECAARGGRVLQVGHLERFNPAIQAIAGQIRARASSRVSGSHRSANAAPTST